MNSNNYHQVSKATNGQKNGSAEESTHMALSTYDCDCKLSTFLLYFIFCIATTTEKSAFYSYISLNINIKI